MSNGHIGLRGNLDEESHTESRQRTSTRSTRCGRCRMPNPAAATPESGQEIVNVTNGKLIRLLVDDAP